MNDVCLKLYAPSAACLISATHLRVWYKAWTTLLPVKVSSDLKGVQKDTATSQYMCHVKDRRVNSSDVVVLATFPSGASEASIYTDPSVHVGTGPAIIKDENLPRI